MATYIKRGSAWRVQIRRKGHNTLSRSFDTKTEAERWALGIESKCAKGSWL